MSGISDKTTTKRITRHLEQARSSHADALEKLASGTVFTPQDPRPSERALTEKLEYRLRSLSSSKRNINDAFSLLQTAESGLSEINNMITRMKELNIAAASSTITDQERYFLLVEYEGLFNEVDRVAVTTEFNGMPLLNADSPNLPEQLILRVDDPMRPEGDTARNISIRDDVNTIIVPLKDVLATTRGLGLRSAKELIEDADPQDGIVIEDVEELLEPEDDESFTTSFDEALNRLSVQRHSFGAIQSRLHRSMDHLDIFEENIAAAKSRIADTDYTSEVARMVESKIRMNAATSLLAHSNVNQNLTLSLLNQTLG